MSPDTIVIDSSARVPDADIWFVLPAGFIALPLRELVQSRQGLGEEGDKLNAVSALVDSSHSSEERRQILALLAPVQRMLRLLSHGGVVHCSMGLHRDDEGDGGVLPSLFTLGWRETSWAPRGVTVSRLAAGTPDARFVEVLDLPCGPASLNETLVNHQVVGTAQELLQVTVHIPYPEATKLAILSLSATATHRADHYRNLLREVARMVTFEDPLTANREGV